MDYKIIDQTKLNEFMEKVVRDAGAAASAIHVIMGDKLGLYKTMADVARPISPEELARKTGTNARQIREWLAGQAAGGYVNYDPVTRLYHLPPEQAYVLAEENSPVFIQGGFQVIGSMFKDEAKIMEAMRTGKGLSWADHDSSLYEGTERFFKPNYMANLTSSWIPALDGVEAKMKKGAKVADVGCGHGITTILMAKAYPNSTFYGFDYHQPSIERARRSVEAEGISNAVKFEVSTSIGYPSKNYDVIAFFDCLHDMADPVAACSHALKSLDKDGTLFIVEPFADDKTENNFNPLGRLCYSVSTAICVPASLAFNGIALGAQAGEAKIKEVVTAAGFKRFKRAFQTPFNLVYEAKP